MEKAEAAEEQLQIIWPFRDGWTDWKAIEALWFVLPFLFFDVSSLDILVFPFSVCIGNTLSINLDRTIDERTSLPSS